VGADDYMTKPFSMRGPRGLKPLRRVRLIREEVKPARRR
jgi:DNA-binding response OmpR family regulator